MLERLIEQLFAEARRSLRYLRGRFAAVPGPDRAGGSDGPSGPAGRGRSTGYLPPLPGLCRRVDLPAMGASFRPVDETRVAEMMGVDAATDLQRALDRVVSAALPFKTLIVDRLAALPRLVASLQRATDDPNFAGAAAQAQAVAEATTLLADELVKKAAELVRLAGRLEGTIKARGRQQAQELAQQLEAGVRAFDAALEARKQAAVRSGAILARGALALDFDAVARAAPSLSRDAAVFATAAGKPPELDIRAFTLAGSLGDRALRLQQALISQDYRAIAVLASEAGMQAGIMGDSTVKTAVALIAEARRIREAAAAGGGAFRESTRNLVQAVPKLTGSLTGRTDSVRTLAAELTSAVEHKDYAAAGLLAWRIALAAHIAQHGIVSRAASLSTVTSALHDAAQQGESEAIVTLLEGV